MLGNCPLARANGVQNKPTKTLISLDLVGTPAKMGDENKARRVEAPKNWTHCQLLCFLFTLPLSFLTLPDMQLITPENAEHASSIRAIDNGSLIDADGEEIKPGESIYLYFMGRPHDMPEPWTLISAVNYFSTVNYRLNPRVTVRAANGIERIFSTANVYSPRRKHLI